METIMLKSDAQDVETARHEAVEAIRHRIKEPVVLSWRDDETDTFAPAIPGADPQERWHDYGESLGGKLEVGIGTRFHFIIGDATGFNAPGLEFMKATDRTGRDYKCLKDEEASPERRERAEAYAEGEGEGTTGG